MQWKGMIDFSSKITKDFCVAVWLWEREARQQVHLFRNTPSILQQKGLVFWSV